MDIEPLEFYAFCIDSFYSDYAGHQMEPADSACPVGEQNNPETGGHSAG